MLQKFDFSPKKRVMAVGSLHGVLLVYALFEAICNIIEEERPLQETEVLYISIHISFHVFLITTLVMGAVLENPIFLLPWLIVSFPVFATVSYFTLKYSRFTYISQFTFNICFICLGWYLWFTVCQFCRDCFKNRNHRIEKT